MKFNASEQRLLVLALKTQIDAWRTLSQSGQLSEEDEVHIQNDIGHAYTVLSEMESSYYKEFGFDADGS
jgi:hypothetical protein